MRRDGEALRELEDYPAATVLLGGLLYESFSGFPGAVHLQIVVASSLPRRSRVFLRPSLEATDLSSLC